MPNDRLREAMMRASCTQQALADAVGVDPKTVERWVRQNRVPHRRIAERAARALHEDVHVLWPVLRSIRPARAVHSELVALYPRRADAPGNLWWTCSPRRKRISISSSMPLYSFTNSIRN
jgi:transcriptional regulator with XRE-family HTH domain